MIVLHMVVALLFASLGAAYGVWLGFPPLRLGSLYGSCGAFGLVLSISVALGLRDRLARGP